MNEVMNFINIQESFYVNLMKKKIWHVLVTSHEWILASGRHLENKTYEDIGGEKR